MKWLIARSTMVLRKMEIMEQGAIRFSGIKGGLGGHEAISHLIRIDIGIIFISRG